jgi:uncharacterized membrane protein YkoI
MRGLTGVLGLVAAGLIVLGSAVLAGEKVEPGKLPEKVQAAIKARFPGAEITSAEKEKEGDKIVYDIELKHKGRKYEMDIEENGTVIEIEKEVDLKDVPAAVLKAIEAKYPKSKVKEVMEVNKVNGKEEKPEHYEVTLETADGKALEVIVSLDGKTVKEEGK